MTQSRAAYFLGIPIAYLGLGMYLLFAALAVARAFLPFSARRLVLTGYLLSGLGTLVSLLLTYYSVRVVGTFCAWCLGSAITMSLTLTIHAFLAQVPVPLGNRSRELHITVAIFVVAAGSMLLAYPLIQSRASVVRYDPHALSRTTFEDLVPKAAHRQGDLEAKVAVVMFGDLTCSACKAALPQLERVVARHPGTQLVFRHLPIASHPLAKEAAILSELAAKRGKFWEFVSAFFEKDFFSEVEGCLDFAEDYGVNREEAARAIDRPVSPAHRAVLADSRFAKRLGFTATPTIAVVARGVPPRIVSPSAVEGTLTSMPFRGLMVPFQRR